ncbi:MAG: XdhC family protein [Candidatus Rokuibacteriota bacterium]
MNLLSLAAELERRGEPFVLATVVRCEPPTSAKPGAKALIREDGTLEGWVGGACAEPTVVREAREALRDGRPRLIGLTGEGGRTVGRTAGILEYPMTCHSGGTLEIYVEPYLPKPLLALVGHGPVIDALTALGRAAGYAVEVLPTGPTRDGIAVTRRTSVVVATHADSDEDALDWALRSEAGYVSLVASRRRAAVVAERLKARGVPAERLGRLKAPAGLDLGAVTPQEIAVSILAEIIQHLRSDKVSAAEVEARDVAAAATTARDPVCGMLVEIATAKHRSDVEGGTVYFCCGGCKVKFDREPTRFPASA